MGAIEDIAGFGDVPVSIEAELGRPTMTVRQILELAAGSVIELERAAGENIDIRVGGVLIGFGEVVPIENSAAIRITDFRTGE